MGVVDQVRNISWLALGALLLAAPGCGQAPGARGKLPQVEVSQAVVAFGEFQPKFAAADPLGSTRPLSKYLATAEGEPRIQQLQPETPESRTYVFNEPLVFQGKDLYLVWSGDRDRPDAWASATLLDSGAKPMGAAVPGTFDALENRWFVPVGQLIQKPLPEVDPLELHWVELRRIREGKESVSRVAFRLRAPLPRGPEVVTQFSPPSPATLSRALLNAENPVVGTTVLENPLDRRMRVVVDQEPMQLELQISQVVTHWVGPPPFREWETSRFQAVLSPTVSEDANATVSRNGQGAWIIDLPSRGKARISWRLATTGLPRCVLQPERPEIRGSKPFDAVIVSPQEVSGARGRASRWRVAFGDPDLKEIQSVRDLGSGQLDSGGWADGAPPAPCQGLY